MSPVTCPSMPSSAVARRFIERTRPASSKTMTASGRAWSVASRAAFSFNLLKAIWLSADYQRLWNPAYNADRGPVNFVGGRVHAEF